MQFFERLVDCLSDWTKAADERVGHPNNIFWFQAQLANQVYQALDQRACKQALITRDMPF